MTGLAQIRSTFLDYFKRQGHEIVASSPLVPRNDPTLMFANSGMVQFKNVFTGMEKRPYTRATTAQKCVRAGGKHNDLDNVGYTARHHTFFEMLGNFSFGDYFKPDAIEWAWTLVTSELGLPKDKLTVTVYSEDDEAHALWKKIAGLPDSRIIRIPTSDNFWSMGDTGPCGPCSEIFFDHGDKIWGGPPGSAEADGDRFIEIWNLVFMQYEQISKDERVNLPKPSIDTGMGLERIAAVLQGTHDNYETDLFRALISAIVEKTGVPATGDAKASNRVIADHLRASSFLIADGVLPSNEGRGYVLRRIMRRAMRHAELLGAKEPLMHRLVPALVREMGAAYNELVRAEALITETLYLEENRFKKTLERGLRLLDEDSSGLGKGDTFSGETAFKLYDTYGFPLDLTQDALKPRGITVDTAAFEAAMEAQREEARRAWKGSGDAKTETIWFELKERFGATEFLGYDTETAEGIVRAIVVDGKEVQASPRARRARSSSTRRRSTASPAARPATKGVIRTAEGAIFPRHRHAEAGGRRVRPHRRSAARQHQAGQRGGAQRRPHAPLRQPHPSLGHPPPARGAAPDARRPRGAEGLAGRAQPPALRHFAQQGDEPGRDRPGGADRQRHRAAERPGLDPPDDGGRRHRRGRHGAVRREVWRRGARRLHGPQRAWRGPPDLFARTLRRHACGPHRRHRPHQGGGRECGRRRRAPHRGAGGLRRARLSRGAGPPRAGRSRSAQGAGRRDRHPHRNTARRAPQARARAGRSQEAARHGRRRKGGGDEGISEVNGIKLMARVVKGISPNDMKGLVDEGKARLGSGVVALVGLNDEGRAGLVVGVTSDLVSRFSAIDLVRAGAAVLGGKGGGGRPDMAQAGGPDGAKADEALAAVKAALG